MFDHPSTVLARAAPHATRRESRHGAVGHLLLTTLWIAASGCTSVYHRTRATLPPEPGAQLAMRLDEARRAERFASQAGARLRDDLARGLSWEFVQADLDRLEMAAYELERRTQTVRETACFSEGHSEMAAELEHLNRRSTALLDYVNAVRKTDPSAHAERLDELLRSPPAPPTPAPR
jgi:hypothetical protein